MTRRKDRLRVVFDTNVFVGHYLSRNPLSTNTRVVRLWRDARELQLIVSDEVAAEYIEVLRRLRVREPRIERFAERLQQRDTITRVSLGPRPTASRDPDDNIVLATALVGKAGFLITNDDDLLDIPAQARRRFRFEIISPAHFLGRIDR